MDKQFFQELNQEQTPEEIKIMADADEMLEGEPRPTSKQVAWVFVHLYHSLMSYCSFRRLIYNRMQFVVSDYMRLHAAGGLSINNALFDEAERIEKEASKFLADQPTPPTTKEG